MAERTMHQPIGVFDSGVGGLSIVRALWREIPREDIIYLADSRHCPYGPRSTAEIEQFATGIVRFLLSQGAKTIVVACNTASAAALGTLRARFPQTPIVGMVPAVKPAAAWSRTGVVGVLATPATFDGMLYQDVLRNHARATDVVNAVCSGLVEMIERGQITAPETRALIEACLAPILASKADALVLGCTHYPFIEHVVRDIAGNRLRIFEPSEAVARQARRVLDKRDLLSDAQGVGTTRLFTTGSAGELSEVTGRLMGQRLVAQQIRWDQTETRLSLAGDYATSRL